LNVAQLTHPFHPLSGRRFPVLRRRTVSGVELLTLCRESDQGVFVVPREWTDLHPPCPAPPEGVPPVLDYESLCGLARLLGRLSSSSHEDLRQGGT